MAGVGKALHDGFAKLREAHESGLQSLRVCTGHASEPKSRRHECWTSPVAAAKLRKHPNGLVRDSLTIGPTISMMRKGQEVEIGVRREGSRSQFGHLAGVFDKVRCRFSALFFSEFLIQDARFLEERR